jgi:hypothetical protein
MQVKVKTFKVPNLDSTTDNVITLEDEIKNYVKNKLEDGYTFSNSVGGDAFIVLIFTKA